jgi:replicative DNA helicase
MSKLNKKTIDGFELNTIVTISAQSGSGKSALAKEFRHSISELNPNLKFKQIILNFEMIALAQVNREISTKAKKTMSELYSVDKKLEDIDILALEKYYNSIKDSEIYFVETTVTPEILVALLYNFWYTQCKEGGYTMIYEIDNLMLIDGLGEKEKIDKTNYKLVALKKQIASEGGTSIGLVLTQMNRNIETVERVNTPELHKPMTSDLMAASSTNFCSDYIIFAHIPAKLGLKKYTNKCLPTKVVSPDRFGEFPRGSSSSRRSSGCC